MAYRLAPTPGTSGSVDLLHPNGGVLLTIHDSEERFGQLAADLLLATFNGESRRLLEQASDHVRESEARAKELRRLLDEARTRLKLLEPFNEKATEFRAIVADAQCWFQGFAASHAGKETWERPILPDHNQLRELNLALLSLVPSTPETEIPF